MTERWLSISRFPLYEVSNKGRVRRLYKTRGPRVLKAYLGKRGYYTVSLRHRGKTHLTTIHRLVAEVFRGPRPFIGAEVRHVDGNKKHNHVENIRWGSRTDNEADKVLHGTSNRGERHGMSRLTDAQVRDIVTRYERGESPRLLAHAYNINRSYPARLARGMRRERRS